MSREPVEIPPIAEHWWDRGLKRRPSRNPTATLSIELGVRAYGCYVLEARVRNQEDQLELWSSHVRERQRSLERRLAELDRLEAEIMAELTDA